MHASFIKKVLLQSMKYAKKKEKNVLITAALPPFPTVVSILKLYFSIALFELPYHI